MLRGEGCHRSTLELRTSSSTWRTLHNPPGSTMFSFVTRPSADSNARVFVQPPLPPHPAPANGARERTRTHSDSVAQATGLSAHTYRQHGHRSDPVHTGYIVAYVQYWAVYRPWTSQWSSSNTVHTRAPPARHALIRRAARAAAHWASRDTAHEGDTTPPRRHTTVPHARERVTRPPSRLAVCAGRFFVVFDEAALPAWPAAIRRSVSAVTRAAWWPTLTSSGTM